MEVWDAYDAKFQQITNTFLRRGETIPDGFYHLVCEVIVRHYDGTYLLMQRDPHKRFGGMWEATAGGSALQGESPLACAIRELREETGIIAQKLTELGRMVNHTTHTIYTDFLCVTNWNKKSVILQQGETVAYKWISGNELINMPEGELAANRTLNFLKELEW